MKWLGTVVRVDHEDWVAVFKKLEKLNDEINKLKETLGREKMLNMKLADKVNELKEVAIEADHNGRIARNTLDRSVGVGWYFCLHSSQTVKIIDKHESGKLYLVECTEDRKSEGVSRVGEQWWMTLDELTAMSYLKWFAI